MTEVENRAPKPTRHPKKNPTTPKHHRAPGSSTEYRQIKNHNFQQLYLYWHKSSEDQFFVAAPANTLTRNRCSYTDVYRPSKLEDMELKWHYKYPYMLPALCETETSISDISFCFVLICHLCWISTSSTIKCLLGSGPPLVHILLCTKHEAGLSQWNTVIKIQSSPSFFKAVHTFITSLNPKITSC